MPRRTLPSNLVFCLLLILAALGFSLAPYLIFKRTPIEPAMGFIQKIFFFHVPCAWAMFLASIIAAVGGAAFLWRQKRWGAQVNAAAAELTVIFGVLVLITGPLWAKIAWGQYWVWEVRLTTMFLLFLIFVAVLLVRQYGGAAREQLAAGLAIFGAVDVPIIYLSVKLWRTIHPQTSVVTTLPSEMKPPFFLSLLVFTILFALLFICRFKLERLRQKTEMLQISLDERRTN